MKNFKEKELPAFWSLLTILVEGMAIVGLIIHAYGYPEKIIKTLIAFAAAVLIVNLLAKLYLLIRK